MGILADWNQASKTVTKEEWLRRLETIQDHRLKIKIACIVEWDYFSSFVGSPEWKILQEYIHECSRESTFRLPDLEPKLIARGLMQVGWPKKIAFLRAKPPHPRYDTPKTDRGEKKRSLYEAIMQARAEEYTA
jgi:hypothetical protein